MNFDYKLNEVWLGYTHGCFDDCEKCHKFAKQYGLKMRKNGCPWWKHVDPPNGDGYQMWNSFDWSRPISPIFETEEELANWMTDNKIKTFTGTTMNYKQWLSVVKNGGCVSCVITPYGVISGAEYVSISLLEKIKLNMKGEESNERKN